MKKLIFILILLSAILPSCSSQAPDAPIITDNFPETEGENFETITANAEETEVNNVPLEKTASDILSSMTLEEKVGQLFLARNPKTKEEGLNMINKYHVGGIIFFGRDFKNSNPDEFRTMIEDYNRSSKISLLTAVDEEGGTVCRASLYKSFRNEKFRSPAELYASGGLKKIKEDAAEKSEFLLNLGLNFNLAPVADISTNEDDFIFERSLGKGREETAKYVSETIKVMNKKNILSALKHFPGYGNNKDTHTGIAYDERSYESIAKNDLIPFESGIKAGAPVVMVSHNIVKSIDPEMPASISEKVTGILRNRLSFDGVIMTDDLSMDAIKDFTESGEAAVLAILAGCDLLCCSDVETQYNAVMSAIIKGRITEERIECSTLRIINLKLKYGIFE